MRILINDFGGYAFISQLARALPALGVEVDHCYCDSLTTTPHGNVISSDVDNRLSLFPIKLREPLQKYSFVKRRFQEIEYGGSVAKLIQDRRPDVIVSANTPLDALKQIWKSGKKFGSKNVFWLQDLIGEATHRILTKKVPLAGSLIGQFYVRLEEQLLRSSDLVLPISKAFYGYLEKANVSRDRIHVFENWAPIEEIPLVGKDNPWSRKNGLHERFVVLYSGTLSMKHDPSLILAVAKALESVGGLMVVRSQGLGANWLVEKNKSGTYPNLIVDDYVPYHDLPASLASANVLLAVLETDAAKYSVPSKVLTYLSAGRAVLLVSPTENLAAQKVLESNGGLVIGNADNEGLTNAVTRLANSPELVSSMGTSARAFAEQQFDISRISSELLNLIRAL